MSAYRMVETMLSAIELVDVDMLSSILSVYSQTKARQMIPYPLDIALLFKQMFSLCKKR